jgi:hypothetical protein
MATWRSEAWCRGARAIIRRTPLETVESLPIPVVANSASAKVVQTDFASLQS